jgi:hypothetical protein
MSQTVECACRTFAGGVLLPWGGDTPFPHPAPLGASILAPSAYSFIRQTLLRLPLHVYVHHCRSCCETGFDESARVSYHLPAQK